MKFVDIHTHAKFNPDFVQIRDLSTKYAEENYNPAYFSMGIHPWYVQEKTLFDDLQKLEAEMGNTAFLAIGECGLDKACQTNFDLQLKAFQMQIDLSQIFKKPIILHIVKAYNELMKI
ncbi:MAG: TatD family hydrolase, partial [Bacteroidales bacterium]|nr:TatD family hydrolase [Bacteroidales bacterium]